MYFPLEGGGRANTKREEGAGTCLGSKDPSYKGTKGRRDAGATWRDDNRKSVARLRL